jgi:hypothetical protein
MAFAKQLSNINELNQQSIAPWHLTGTIQRFQSSFLQSKQLHSLVPTHPGTFSRSFVRPFTEPNLPIDNSGNFLAPVQDKSNHANV